MAKLSDAALAALQVKIAACERNIEVHRRHIDFEMRAIRDNESRLALLMSELGEAAKDEFKRPPSNKWRSPGEPAPRARSKSGESRKRPRRS